MVSATDGSNVTTGTCNVAVEIDGVAGTGGTATHIANGKWEYAPIQADTNGDYLTFQFVITGAVTATMQVYTSSPQTGDTYALAAGATGFAAINTDVEAILADTEEIGTAGAGLTNLGGSANNWNVGKTGYSLTATTGLGNQTANITGNLSGSVGSVTGAVGSVTGAVGSVTSDVTADVTKISGTAAAADKLEASMETMILGTATGGTTSTVTSAVTGHGDDTFIGRVLLFRSGTLQYEAGAITDYDSTAGTFTFAAATWTTSPTTETFVIV